MFVREREREKEREGGIEREIQVNKCQEKKSNKKEKKSDKKKKEEKKSTIYNLALSFYLENRIYFKHNARCRKRSEHSRDDRVGVKPSRRKLTIHLFRRSGSLTASGNLEK